MTASYIPQVPPLHQLKEPELKTLAIERMSPHFRVVDGDADDVPECVHFFTGKILRPDLICFPLKPLREKGWPDWMFYVEIKDAVSGNNGSRITEAAWQAKVYQDCVCRFRMPAFTLVFPNFEVFIKGEDSAFKAYAHWFSGYMQRERVGELFLPANGTFKIKFSSGVLYDSENGRSNFNLLDRQHRWVCQ